MNTDYKLLLIGDAHVGKTTYLKALRNYPFSDQYDPTMGMEILDLEMIVSDSVYMEYLNISIHDISGIELHNILDTHDYRRYNGILIMVDKVSSEYLTAIQGWIHMIRDITDTIPIVLVHSKTDLIMGIDTIYIERKLGSRCIPISSMSGTNCIEPIRYMMSLLLGRNVNIEL